MAETNHDGCEQECGCWEEGFADALAGMQEWSITVHDGICRCEFCVTGIALIEAALGDMAGILREIRGELKPAALDWEVADDLSSDPLARNGYDLLSLAIHLCLERSFTVLLGATVLLHEVPEGPGAYLGPGGGAG